MLVGIKRVDFVRRHALERAAKQVEGAPVAAERVVDATVRHRAADAHVQPLDASEVQAVQVEHVAELRAWGICARVHLIAAYRESQARRQLASRGSVEYVPYTE